MAQIRKNRRGRRRNRPRLVGAGIRYSQPAMYQQSSLNQNGVTIVPPHITKKLIFEESVPINSVGLITNLQVRGNSIFDVTLTSGAELSPQGYSQWKNFYNYYEVLSSSCQVTASLADRSLNIALTPTISVTTFASYSNAVSQAYSAGKTLNLATGGHDQIIINKQMPTRLIHGAKGSEVSPFTANFGTTPTKQFFWNLTIQNATGATTEAYSFLVKVRVTYVVRMYGRKVVLNTTPPKPFVSLPRLRLVKQTRPQQAQVFKIRKFVESKVPDIEDMVIDEEDDIMVDRVYGRYQNIAKETLLKK